ncbi:MAG: PepSY domain-containing protein [Beijerinckiaceae bacterium]|nr:PepSY domain-containing protein [Beijerinckiaceae bacterium]
MSVKLSTAVFMCAALLGVTFTPAYAGRAPNPEERARIEETLRAAGYVSWDEIELDDGVWEVDDARRAGSGPECDIEISPRTYEIVRTDC